MSENSCFYEIAVRRIVALCVPLCLCLLLAGCTKVMGISLPAGMELEKGDTAQLELEYTYDNAEASDEEKADAAGKTEITYTVEGGAVTVDETGLVTAAEGGEATVTATLKGGITASCVVTVKVPTERVEAPEELVLYVGGEDSAQLGAKALPEDATSALGYKSSDEAVASVDASGNVTAAAPGECIITTASGGKTTETKVTVKVAATGITLGSEGGVLYVGNGVQLKPRTLPAEADASTYTYASSNTKVATVTAEGWVQAVGAGSATITVTSAEGHTAAYAVVAKVYTPPKKQTGTASGGTAATGGAGAAGGGAATPSGGGAPSGGGTTAPSGGDDGFTHAPSDDVYIDPNAPQHELGGFD